MKDNPIPKNKLAFQTGKATENILQCGNTH
jgi:hypothetical protein